MHNSTSTKQTVRLIPLKSAILVGVLFLLIISMFYVNAEGQLVIRDVWSSVVAAAAAVVGFVLGLWRLSHTTVIVELKKDADVKEVPE